MFQGNKKGRPRAETHITRWTEEKALLVGIRFCVVDHDPSFICFLNTRKREEERERDADLSTSLLSFISLHVIWMCLEKSSVLKRTVD